MNTSAVSDKQSANASTTIYDSGGITVTLQDHGVKTLMTLSESVDAELSAEWLKAILEGAGVTHGIQDQALERLAKEHPLDEPVLVAQGTPPEHGEDGQIKFHVEPPDPHKIRGAVRDDGSVDFKRLNLITNIEADEVLATRHPPTPGTPGRAVTGEEIRPTTGRDVKLPKGRNTRISEDGTQLIAECDGSLIRTGGSVSITELYTVNGDVDFSTGNIEFKGSVVVTHNVLSGFSIKARDNITVNGIVEAAHLEAGGDIILQRGVQGADKAVLIAGGNIHANFIQSATVQAGGDIEVHGPLLHCRSTSGRRIQAEGKNGTLCGGTVEAFERVRARTLGADAYTRTLISVGRNTRLTKRLAELQESLTELEEKLSKAMAVISALKRLQTKLGQLPPDKAKIMMHVTRTQFALAKNRKELQEEIETLQQEMRSNREAQVICEGACYPGVVIQIMEKKLLLNESLRTVVFVRDSDGICARPHE